MKTTPQDPGPLGHEPPEELQRAQEDRLREVWAQPKGWRYWSAVNNTEVGVWYTAAAFIFFLFAGVLAPAHPHPAQRAEQRFPICRKV